MFGLVQFRQLPVKYHSVDISMAKVLLASLFGDIPQEQVTYSLLSSIASNY